VESDGGVRGDFLDGSKRHSAYQSMESHVVTSSLAAAGLLALAALAASRSPRDRQLGVILRAGAAAFTGKALLAAFYES
jgi:hypothetical protein